ncbi:Ras small monomeric GTPase RasB [Ascosphaera apis ARSEF 7405]|uniref:Ras small monomeric GTPase RasB n=1 Tax=Ascosphaera apis ARSEF 7405 TaxID=392613 RepID=A0A167VQM1_9EURO|nr:Ras small monomeric GTPase RasB [Ascosphaera apis ARSEF 7405]
MILPRNHIAVCLLGLLPADEPTEWIVLELPIAYLSTYLHDHLPTCLSDWLTNFCAPFLPFGIVLFQLCLNHFVETYDPTIEDSYRKQVVIDGQSCMLEVLDTAGQEEYIALRDQWIRDGEGFILVYSITSRASFSRMQRFYQQIQLVKESSMGTSPSGGSYLSSSGPMPSSRVPVMLVGNKLDKTVERVVSLQEGQALAKQLGCEFTEASAKTNANVEKAFFDIVRVLRQQRQSLQPSQSSGKRGTAFGQSGFRDSGSELQKGFRSERKSQRFRCTIL